LLSTVTGRRIEGGCPYHDVQYALRTTTINVAEVLVVPRARRHPLEKPYYGQKERMNGRHR
jgi:hypothetical protein